MLFGSEFWRAVDKKRNPSYLYWLFVPSLSDLMDDVMSYIPQGLRRSPSAGDA